jgi:hypothetical protein
MKKLLLLLPHFRRGGVECCSVFTLFGILNVTVVTGSSRM